MSLLVNEHRQLSGARDQAVMPAWTANTLDADLVEFRSVQVASSPMQQMASGKYGNKSRSTSSMHYASSVIHTEETRVLSARSVSTCYPTRAFACICNAMHVTPNCRDGHYIAALMQIISA